jgi:hypothetical protein
LDGAGLGVEGANDAFVDEVVDGAAEEAGGGLKEVECERAEANGGRGQGVVGLSYVRRTGRGTRGFV